MFIMTGCVPPPIFHVVFDVTAFIAFLRFRRLAYLCKGIYSIDLRYVSRYLALSWLLFRLQLPVTNRFNEDLPFYNKFELFFTLSNMFLDKDYW
jgi:hypothetical protein